MQGLPSLLSLFCTQFKKFNYTGAQIYHMTLKLQRTLKVHFRCENVKILHYI